jgi:uncharacterized membrane protein
MLLNIMVIPPMVMTIANTPAIVSRVSEVIVIVGWGLRDSIYTIIVGTIVSQQSDRGECGKK